jgi:sec-independent protein translocase protein TatA
MNMWTNGGILGVGAALPLAVIGTWHMVILVMAILLMFGGKKVPELARGLGKGLRIFRDEMHGMQKDATSALGDPLSMDAPKQIEERPLETSAEKKDTA